MYSTVRIEPRWRHRQSDPQPDATKTGVQRANRGIGAEGQLNCPVPECIVLLGP